VKFSDRITFDAKRAKAMKRFHETIKATNARNKSGNPEKDAPLAKALFELTGGIMRATFRFSPEDSCILTKTIVSAASPLTKKKNYAEQLIKELPIVAKKVIHKASPFDVPSLDKKFKTAIQNAKNTLG